MFWNTLLRMIESFTGPWLGIGDFNEILAISDKRDGRPYASPSFGGLPSVMQEKGLVDLGFLGNPFTWTNKGPLQANIHERLDRGLGNPQWRILFPNATIKHLPAFKSDHNPILLNTAENPVIPPNLEDLILRSVSEEDNRMLCAMPSQQEISKAINHMGSNKVPGPDGMTAMFYKTYWKTIKRDVINSVTSFFSSGYLLKGQNHTHIALIPKSDNPILGVYWPVFVPVKLFGRKPEKRYKWEPMKDDVELGNSAYPMVLVQIPMYNEIEVYQLLIGAACGLSWPSDRIIIQVLDDSTDPLIKDMVELECQRWASKGINIQYQIRDNRNGYKAGSLKEGFKHDYVKQCDYVAILRGFSTRTRLSLSDHPVSRPQPGT
ncbi:hypothetical protein RJ639_046220 [Escallonia herrerae]|uniref:Glycosyltransferase 2-like domain-containing protein n=1 Tax=Escallonia herrerae TaxID=1293975 RepID=A0AA88W3M5_9ASTE|nr:hypothetical protein RJ639_046220 [Escallonia herrerae]